MADEVDEVVEFLRSRNIEVDVLKRFREEKMDFMAVEHTPEHVLVDMGLTRKGDIYTLKAICQRKKKSTDDDHERETRKRHLVQEIMKEKESRGKKKFLGAISADDKSRAGKQLAKTRRISLGLMQFNKQKNKYCSVRYSKGGGTRSVDVPVTMTRDELIEEGKALFFQNGECPLGAESEMCFELVNFKGEIINSLEDRNGKAHPFTVQKYFEVFKLSKVQLYIAVRSLFDEDDSCDEDLMKSPFSQSDKEPKWRQNLQPKGTSVAQDNLLAIPTASGLNRGVSHWYNSQLEDERMLKAEQDKEYQESLEIDSRKRKALEDEIAELSRLEDVRRAREARVPKELENDAGASAQVLIVVQHPFHGRVSRHFSAEEIMLAVYDWVGSLNHHPEHFSLRAQPAVEISPQDRARDFQSVVIYVETLKQPLPMSFTSPEVSFKGFGAVGDSMQVEWSQQFPESQNDLERVSAVVPLQLLKDDNLSDSESEQKGDREPIMTLEERARQWRASLTSEVTHEVPNDNVEGLRQKLYSELASDEPIQVSRPSVLPDLLRYYENGDLVSSTIRVTFADEEGEDYGGLTQDLFSAFWEQAFEVHFDGEEIKVPFASPSNLLGARSTFEAMGRIFSHGFILTGAIPVRFCQSSIMGAFLGSQSVPEHVLLRDLLSYVSEREARVMSLAMSATEKESITDEQEDTLFSVFTRCDMRIAPVWGERLKEQLIKLARFVFILRPMCILQWMADGVPQSHVDELWSRLSPSDFESLYEALRPSVPRVLQSLKLSDERDLKPEEEVVFYYLKDFVGNMDQALLERFLRFITGRPSVSVSPITVSFNRAEGLARAPKVSTCSNCLVISVCYPTLSEFKKEFTNVLLSSEAYEMHSI